MLYFATLLRYIVGMDKINLYGSHLSIAGGFHKAVERAHNLGCVAVQIFVKAPGSWRTKIVTAQDAERFFAAQERFGIRHFVAHSAYLPNLATPAQSLHERSVTDMTEEMRNCQALHLPYLVFHPGSYKGTTEEDGLRRVAESIDEIYERLGDTSVSITIETTAGQGTNLGYRFEQIAQIIALSQNKDRLSVCMDTCHIFAAGYDIRTEEAFWRTIEEFDKIISLSRLKVIHLNDSKAPLGSRKDRHEHIGKGEIGETPFRILMTDERFRLIPKILETPKDREDKFDRENLRLLRSFIEGQEKNQTLKEGR